MESKEHTPWIASMLATAVAFVVIPNRATVLNDAPLRKTATRRSAMAKAGALQRLRTGGDGLRPAGLGIVLTRRI